MRQVEEGKAQLAQLQAALDAEKQENAKHLAQHAADEVVTSSLKERVNELEGHHDHLRDLFAKMVSQLSKGTLSHVDKHGDSLAAPPFMDWNRNWHADVKIVWSGHRGRASSQPVHKL